MRIIESDVGPIHNNRGASGSVEHDIQWMKVAVADGGIDGVCSTPIEPCLHLSHGNTQISTACFDSFMNKSRAFDRGRASRVGSRPIGMVQLVEVDVQLRQQPDEFLHSLWMSFHLVEQLHSRHQRCDLCGELEIPVFAQQPQHARRWIAAVGDPVLQEHFFSDVCKSLLRRRDSNDEVLLPRCRQCLAI